MTIIHPRASLRITRTLARLLFACGLVAALAGCDGPLHAPPNLVMTVTGTDDATTRTRGQDAQFTFTVTNTSSSTVPDVTMSTSSDSLAFGSSPTMHIKSITCSAQGATCPAAGTNPLLGTATMPAGSVLSFTVTTTVDIDYDGQATQQFLLYSPARSGSVTARVHVTLADARDGGYEIFSTSGRLDALAVHLIPGAMTFWVSSDNAPASFTADSVAYVFADGSHMISLDDLFVGSYDFGNGPEAFIAARNMVTTLAELDGATFTTFTADTTSGAATTAVNAAWISSSTLNVCRDAAPRDAASCPPASTWHYALTLNGQVFTGVDSVHGDTLAFQVARSGDARILLRAEKAGPTGHFAIGLPSVAPTTRTPQYNGTVAGQWVDLALGADGAATAPFLGATKGFAQFGPIAALQTIAGRPPGLRQGVRTSDGATLLVADNAPLAVQVAPGELDIFGLVVP